MQAKFVPGGFFFFSLHLCRTARIPQVPATGRQHRQRDETCRTLNDNNFNLPHHHKENGTARVATRPVIKNGVCCLATQNGADLASITLPPPTKTTRPRGGRKQKKNIMMLGEEENGKRNENYTCGKFGKSREKRTRIKNTDERE